MDDPGCDRAVLERTYAQFPLVNGAFAGWKHTYRTYIRTGFTGPSHSLIDIGSGGGDLARALVRWAARDGVSLRVSALDPDPRAQEYARRQPRTTPAISWRTAHSSDLVAAGERADFVVSNHVLHHLTGRERAALWQDSEALARIRVVHSDIARSSAAYLGFFLATSPLALPGIARSTFIRRDGLTSIRRSLTPGELARELPPGWRVGTQAPARVLALWEPRRGRG